MILHSKSSALLMKRILLENPIIWSSGRDMIQIRIPGSLFVILLTQKKNFWIGKATKEKNWTICSITNSLKKFSITTRENKLEINFLDSKEKMIGLHLKDQLLDHIPNCQFLLTKTQIQKNQFLIKPSQRRIWEKKNQKEKRKIWRCLRKD